MVDGEVEEVGTLPAIRPVDPQLHLGPTEAPVASLEGHATDVKAALGGVGLDRIPTRHPQPLTGTVPLRVVLSRCTGPVVHYRPELGRLVSSGALLNSRRGPGGGSRVVGDVDFAPSTGVRVALHDPPRGGAIVRDDREHFAVQRLLAGARTSEPVMGLVDADAAQVYAGDIVVARADVDPD